MFYFQMMNIHVVTVDHVSGGNLIRNKQGAVMTVIKVKIHTT